MCTLGEDKNLSKIAVRVHKSILGYCGEKSMSFPEMLAKDVLHKGIGMYLRATYIVDPEGTIRFVSVNDLSVGRNPQEVLRVLDALQTDELCPCNWEKGQATL